MNLDTYLDAAAMSRTMKDFKRHIGKDGEKSYSVLVDVLCGCAADRHAAVENPTEFFAEYACSHGGDLGRKAELLSNSMQNLEEAFRD